MISFVISFVLTLWFLFAQMKGWPYPELVQFVVGWSILGLAATIFIGYRMVTYRFLDVKISNRSRYFVDFFLNRFDGMALGFGGFSFGLVSYSLIMWDASGLAVVCGSMLILLIAAGMARNLREMVAEMDDRGWIAS